MSIVPDQSERNDIIDIVLEAAKRTVPVRQADGSVQLLSQLDDEILWWRTLIVSSHRFSRFAFMLRELERLGAEAMDNMHEERASGLQSDIIEFALSYRRSLDAKSAETSRDGRSTQSILLDRIAARSIEKKYVMEGDDKKGIAAFFGGSKEDT